MPTPALVRAISFIDCRREDADPTKSEISSVSPLFTSFAVSDEICVKSSLITLKAIMKIPTIKDRIPIIKTDTDSVNKKSFTLKLSIRTS